MPATAKFCSECGTKVEVEKITCGECGAENKPGAKFCVECGSSLSAPVKKQVQKKQSKKEPASVEVKTSDAIPDRSGIIGAVAAVAAMIVLTYAYFGMVAPISGKDVWSGDMPHAQEAEDHQHTPGDDHAHDTSSLPEPPSEEEVQAARDQLAADPENAELNINMGNILFDSQKYQEAVDYYAKAIAKQPNNADVLVDAGVCYFNMKDLTKANQYFNLALKANPQHINALYNLGIVALQNSEADKLIQYWTRLQEIAPSSQQAVRASQILQQIHQEVQNFSKKDS